jgi:hypothetical protein
MTRLSVREIEDETFADETEREGGKAHDGEIADLHTSNIYS